MRSCYRGIFFTIHLPGCGDVVIIGNNILEGDDAIGIRLSTDGLSVHRHLHGFPRNVSSLEIAGHLYLHFHRDGLCGIIEIDAGYG